MYFILVNTPILILLYSLHSNNAYLRFTIACTFALVSFILMAILCLLTEQVFHHCNMGNTGSERELTASKPID